MSRGLCWCCHMRFADFSLRMILDICSAKPPLKHMVHPCQLPAPYLQTACTLRSHGMNPTIAMQDLAHIKSQTKFKFKFPLTWIYIYNTCCWTSSLWHGHTHSSKLSTPFRSKPQSRVCEPVFPLCRPGSFVFFAGGSGILNSNWHAWQWKEEAMVCEIHMHNFKSHFRQDFLACDTSPVSVHLAMLLIQQFYNRFAHFKITTKSHENYVFLYPFSNMAISPQNNDF